jgi:hypothetical protein
MLVLRPNPCLARHVVGPPVDPPDAQVPAETPVAMLGLAAVSSRRGST